MSVVIRFDRMRSSDGCFDGGSRSSSAESGAELPWDERTSAMEVSDVPSEVLVHLYREALARGAIAMPAFDPGSFLPNLGLARGVFLTNAGSLMLSGAHGFSVSCGCFSSADHSSLLDARFCSGSLFVLAEESAGFVLRHAELALGSAFRRGVGSMRRYRAVFGELIANALVHRSYEEPGAVRVSVEPGKVIVVNPIDSDASGRRSPFSLHRDELICTNRWVLEHAVGELSSSVGNASLRQASRRLGFARMAGKGLVRVASSCRALGLDLEIGASSDGAFAIVSSS